MSIYKQSGVDYSTLDTAKLFAISAALQTSRNASPVQATTNEATRGEPAFVVEVGGSRIALVLECLGTKSVLAERYLRESGNNRFAAIGYDTVAAVINDLICVGAQPVVINAYFSTGDSDWYRQEDRFQALVTGWSAACQDAGAIWGGGESPTLSGLVNPGEIELAGAAVGIIPESCDVLVSSRVVPGDRIVLVESNGLHANGASIARQLADTLPGGLLSVLPNGQTFGDAVLERSALYAPLLREMHKQRVPLHYISHITGHGFLKLMRGAQELTYRLTALPEVPPVLQFLVTQSGMSLREAYSTFNMGAGLAVYVPADAAAAVVAAALAVGMKAIDAGLVDVGQRSVVLEPLGLVLGNEEYRAPVAGAGADNSTRT